MGAVGGVGSDEMIFDIGPRNIEDVCSALARIKTLVWNGPFGAFELEPFDTGTVEIAEAAVELTAAGKIVTVAGGGDTVAALNAARRDRAVDLCLDRRRRLPRMAGGQALAGGRGAQGQITVAFLPSVHGGWSAVKGRRAKKSATVRPILYDGMESVNKIIEPP